MMPSLITCLAAALLPVSGGQTGVDRSIAFNVTSRTVSQLKELGLYTDFYTSDRAKQLVISRTALTLRYGIETYGTAASEELALIIAKSTSAAELKAGVLSWAKRHDLPLRPVFIGDLADELPKLQAAGLLDPRYTAKDIIRSEDNFINEDIYNALVRANIIPLADPHDLLTHLTILTDLRYAKAHLQYSAIDTEADHLAKQMTGKKVTADFPPGLLSEDPELAFSAIQSWQLSGPGRISSLENFAFVKTFAGKPAFFIQGNALFNGIDRLQLGKIEEFVDFLYIDETLTSFQATSIDFKNFIRSSGKKDTLANLYRVLDDAKIPRGRLRAVRAQVRRKLIDQVRFSIHSHSFNAPFATRETGVIMDELAGFIAKDPELAQMYSYDTRIRILEANNEFMRAYLDWLKGFVKPLS